MSVSAELGKPNARFEYFVCIEGVGWPVDEDDLSQGFNGLLFATNQFVTNDYTSVLGADEVKLGLLLTSGLSDSFDPITNEYEHGGLTFEIVDLGEKFLQTHFQPWGTSSSKVASLGEVVDYNETSIILDETDATFALGDVIWVADSEAILLGGSRTGAGGNDVQYSSCTRGYLGTTQGRRDSLPTTSSGFAWEDETKIRDYSRSWFDKRITLFMRVPGETSVECRRIYNGRIRGVPTKKSGLVYTFQTVYEEAPTMLMHEGVDDNYVASNDLIVGTGQSISVDARDTPDNRDVGLIDVTQVPEYFTGTAFRRIEIISSSQEAQSRYAGAYQYNYRRAVGATAGVLTAINADVADPQCTVLNSRDSIDAYLFVGDVAVRAMFREPGTGSGTDADWNHWRTSLTALKVSELNNSEFQTNAPIRYALDNMHEDWARSRFALNKIVRRNPIDVALMFMLSMNNEFYVGTTQASFTSATALTFTPSPGWTTDQWVGFAAHAQGDGLANSSHARLITANDADTLTVAPGFPSNPGAGKEFTIRNSIFDVLPLRWGMGIDHKRVDIDSFISVRNNVLADATVGRFILRSEPLLDLWDLVQDNILRPHSVLTYIDRVTGKLTARFTGEAFGDGVIETYVDVTSGDLVDIGDINLMPRAKVDRIDLKVRAKKGVEFYYQKVPRGESFVHVEKSRVFHDPLVRGKAEIVKIQPRARDNAYGKSKLEVISATAMLNSSEDVEHIAAIQAGKLNFFGVPLPQVDIEVLPDYALTIQSGFLVSISDTDQFDPIDPFRGQRGWTDMPLRVLSSNLVLSESGPELKFTGMLMKGVNAALIAPAARITGKRTDFEGDWLQLDDDTYKIDTDTSVRDWSWFAINDVVQVRNEDTSEVLGSLTIIGFGASEMQFAVGALTAYTPTANDYVTFDDWATGVGSDNQEDYAHWASSDELLGTDAGKEYL